MMFTRVGKIFFDPNIQLFPDTYDHFIEKKFCPSSHRPNPSPGDQSQYLWLDQSECCNMLSSTVIGPFINIEIGLLGWGLACVSWDKTFSQ